MAATRTAEQWREVVSEWRASGSPAKVFARKKSVNPHTLSWWAWRLGSVGRKRGAASFAEIVVVEPAEAGVPDFVLELGGIRVRVSRGFDEDELRRLVAALC